MAEEPKWPEKAAYAAQWFVLPISFAGWLSAQFLTYVFGVSEWGRPEGYIRILIIRYGERHEYVPPWLAYLYDSVSLVMIVSIALVVFRPIVERDSSEP